MTVMKPPRSTAPPQRWGSSSLPCVCATILAACATTTTAVESDSTALKSESFDRDPGWEGHNNRIVPATLPVVKQDFGYSATHFAGKAAGEIGGTIMRASRAAFYGEKITPRTLDDKLTASGTFALVRCASGGGLFLGWFNVEGRGGSGRPMSALGLEFSGEKAGARLAVRVAAESNQAGGVKVTPFVNDRKLVKGPGNRAFDAVKPDGTHYTWTFSYDPAGSGGNGRIEFTIRGNSAKPQPWEGQIITLDVPAEVRKAGATFDHFGLLNNVTPGHAMEIYFADLHRDGVAQDLSRDPRWDESGNRSTYREQEQRDAHDFGFSAATNLAGGGRGEIGGVMWRGGEYGRYADRTGPLSLGDRLEAGGKVLLEADSGDSTMYLGWFNSADEENPPTQTGGFVGVKVGGPTKVGHYFAPAYATSRTTPIELVGRNERPATVAVEAGKGPLLVPKKVFAWKLVYDPAGEGGQGAVTATLGGESVTLPLKRGDKAKGAAFDRFGLFTAHHGGNSLKIWFDDLKYSAGKP